MKFHQKFGLILMSLAFLLGVVLQKIGAHLYRPEKLDNYKIEIVPAPPDLTIVLALMSTNWMLAAPLVVLFIAGIGIAMTPKREWFEPQFIEIKYVS